MPLGFAFYLGRGDEVVFVDKWCLGPLEKVFPNKCKHAARVGGSNGEQWEFFPEELLSQCYSVWTPLQPMFHGLRLLSANRAFRVDCRVKLIGVSLRRGARPARRRTRRTASRRVEAARQSAGHENVLVWTSFILQWQGGGSVSVRRMSALAAAKETGRGVPWVLAAACSAQASATSLLAIPWWPGIQSRVVLTVRFLGMCLRSAVSVEPHWIASRNDWLSLQMAAAACDGKNHSSAMRMAAFSSSYNEVIAAPHCCVVMRVVGLVGSTSVSTIPVPQFSAPAVAEPSV